MDKVNMTFVNVTQLPNSSNVSYIDVDYTDKEHSNALVDQHLIIRLSLGSIAVVLNFLILCHGLEPGLEIVHIAHMTLSADDYHITVI